MAKFDWRLHLLSLILAVTIVYLKYAGTIG